jgi:murein L,D-transpeptidase YafK
LLLACLAVGVMLPWAATAATPAAVAPCQTNRQAHVVVMSSERRLSLCTDRREVKSFPVRLAWNGPGKHQAGDERLPIGTYRLDVPRDSNKYGVFIPIGYPTPAQAAQGYTGEAIGIHGPPRLARWLGRFVNTFDTTSGCVGIATDGEMREIAAFVRGQHARSIAIR